MVNTILVPCDLAICSQLVALAVVNHASLIGVGLV